MAGDKYLLDIIPLGFLKSNKHEIITNQQRALYEHAVSCKKIQHSINYYWANYCSYGNKCTRG